jgi:hypothetical protein
LNTSETGVATTTDVHNFPLLVRLNSTVMSDIGATSEGGTDIYFTKPDGAPLVHGIERWVDDPGGMDKGEIWVKVDVIAAGNATQRILMHYGDVEAQHVAPSSEAVFDTADGYIFMAHLSDSLTNESDSVTEHTYYQANGHISRDSAGDSLYSAEALIGRGLKSFGNARVRFPNTKGNQPQYTFACWFRPRTLSSFMATLIRTGDTMVRLSYGKFLDAKVKVHVFHNIEEPWFYTMFSQDVRVNRWHHTVLVNDTVNQKLTLYVDGDTAQIKDYSHALPGKRISTTTTSGYQLAGGWSSDLNAFLDQATVVNVARSWDWVKLEYGSQSASAPLVSIGEPTGTAVRRMTPSMQRFEINEFVSARITPAGVHVAMNANVPATASFYGPAGRMIEKRAVGSGGALFRTEKFGPGVYYVSIRSERGNALIPMIIVR